MWDMESYESSQCEQHRVGVIVFCDVDVKNLCGETVEEEAPYFLPGSFLDGIPELYWTKDIKMW